MLLLLLAVGLLASVRGNHIPPGIKLCHKSDPDFTKCVGKNLGEGLKFFGNGNKYYGMPKIEPLFVEQMIMKGGETDSISIEQKYTNVYVHGITTSSSDRNFRLDIDEKCYLIMDVVTPVLRLEADYEITGKMLMFPLNGHGKCNIIMYNLVNTHTMVCERYAVKGKTYLKAIGYTMNMTVDRVTFDFQNIFAGNEQISTEIMKTINENSLLVFGELKKGFEEAFSAVHTAVMNKFFSKEPISEIFLE